MYMHISNCIKYQKLLALKYTIVFESYKIHIYKSYHSNFFNQKNRIESLTYDFSNLV